MATDSNFRNTIKKFLPPWAGGTIASTDKPAIEADLSESGNYRALFAYSYTGEKNMGEMGPLKDYKPAYQILRIRSWQAYLESDIAQTIMKRFCTWMIGSGLKLQSEPQDKVLEMEGIKIDTHEFSEMVEARFNVYRKSKRSDYSGMRNLDRLAKLAYKNAIVGGDVLVILRLINGEVTVQLIDGAHVQSPNFGTESFPFKLENGNVIINGVETDETGKHVGYHVRNATGKFDFVEARGAKTGMQMAFLVYGLEYRLDNNRGLPLIAVVLETLKKMERYKEATVSSAEERAKIAYSIEHTLGSTGANPLLNDMARSFDIDKTDDKLATTFDGKELARTVAATTEKQVINMPINAVLKSLESKTELYFKDFYTVNAHGVCATLEIPPEVAFSKYDSNFSSARAAIKDWENTLLVGREDFAFQFYVPIYLFWLEVKILTNKISAPGYLSAKRDKNFDVLDAYRMARFIGPPVPHIDPLKEVKAERAKLGSAADDIPLGTVEQSTEALNGGESSANMKQFSKELKTAKTLEIIAPAVTVPPKIDNAK